jgi:hypothetical protein
LARYLQAVIGSEQSVAGVSVFERSLRIRRPGLHPPTFVALPRATSAFVRDFDTGSFPELVDQRRGAGRDGKGSSMESEPPTADRPG